MNQRQGWEYRVVSAVAFQAETVQEQLNGMGKTGWELVVGLSELGTYGSTVVQYLIFKRPRIERSSGSEIVHDVTSEA